jgi:predicted nucleic acid-binding protein
MKLIVSDANIFIDMESGGLLEEMFRLAFDIAVPDVIYMEELKDHHPELPGLGLRILTLREEAVGEVEVLAQRYRKPGRNDLFALALAMQESCHLLTSDRDLKAVAIAENVDVHGTLWLMEQMQKELEIEVNKIARAYERMRRIGRRLPWEAVEEQLRQISVNKS